MRILKRPILYLLVAAMALSMAGLFATPASAAAPIDDEIGAKAAVLTELNTGKVLFSKNGSEQLAPASITKIMTVMLALEACDRSEVSLDDVVTVGSDVYFDISSDGSTLEIKPGEEMVFKDVLYCAMLASANEACNIIAEHVCGSVTAFINRMNERAGELGCTGTHFANTHGMPNEAHYTTAQDLALIAANAVDIPTFAEIVATANYLVPENNKSDNRAITNTNKLILKDSPYYFEDATGVKTGYTNAAGYCLVSTAERGDLKLLSVVMGAQSLQIEDGTTQTRSFTESRALLEWGFDNFSYKTIVSPLDLVAEVPIEMGDGADSIVVRPDNTITVLLDNAVDVSRVKLDIVIYNERDGVPLKAPINQGDRLGEATVTLDGVDYGKIRLVANSSVALKHSEYLKAEIRGFFKNVYVRIVVIVLLVLLALYIALVIRYNVVRRRRRAKAKALAQQRVNELREKSGSTIGKSFEEIESLRRKETAYRK